MASCKTVVGADEGLGVAFHLFYICFIFASSPFFLLAFFGIHRGVFLRKFTGLGLIPLLPRA